MDVMYQLMDQVIKAADNVQKPQAKPAERKKSGDDGKDFDSMVRQRRAEGQKSDRAPEKGTGGKEKTTVPRQKETAITNEQYAAAAAMLLQVQPVQIFTEIETDWGVAPLELLHPETIVEDTGEAVQVVNPEAGGDALLQTEEEVQAKPLDTGLDRFRQVLDGVSQGQTEETAGEEDTEQQLPVAAAEQNAALFGYMEAAPVKVSEPAEPIPLEAEDGTERLAQQLGAMIEEDSGSSRIELTLTPPSLGKVTVEIVHHADGALHIALQATTERAASLLERNSAGLQSLLAGQSRSEVHVQVRTETETPYIYVNPDGQNDQQQRQQQQQQQQQQRQQQEQPRSAQDFIQQLRLGLIDISGYAAGY